MARVERYEKQFEAQIRCKGMSQQEFFELYRELKEEELSPSIRNPDPIESAVKTVHEIMVHIGPEVSAVAGFTAKKVYDWLATIVEKKLKERDDGNVEVTIYGANNKPLLTVTRKPDRPKRKG
jgi:hypothetical protein